LINLEARQVDVRRELDRLRVEIGELHASLKRLVLDADADRRLIERELHQSVQQHLVALVVNLQLAGELTDTDPAATKALLEELGRDVQQALDETARLAQRIYAPLLEQGGLAAALRSAAVAIGIPASVEIATEARYPPEVVRTVYLCCLEVLERAGDGARVTVTVREEQGALVFDVVEDAGSTAPEAPRSDADLERLRHRVEALGGRLAMQFERGARVFGSLPLSG
jgi:signal transduction histidine kinase